MPTTESSSPTATRAVNEKRRPPFTTLATRLISITRSCRSSPLGLTLSTAIEPVRVEDGSSGPSEAQASLSRALCDRGDAPVEAIAAAVEDAGLDPCRLGSLPDLAGDVLPGVANALALVGLWGTALADPGCRLADELLVDPADDDLGRLRNLEVDSRRSLDGDGMREAESHLEVLALEL